MPKSPEQLNNQESPLIPQPEGNRPKAELPEWQMWQPKVVKGKDGQLQENSVKSPDGTTYQIREGEHFVVNRGENGDYEAAIVGPDGKKNVLHESLASRKAKQEQQDKEEADRLRGELQEGSEKSTPYDRERLNDLAKKLSQKGALFGREVVLEDEDKKQLGIVCELVGGKINEAMKDSADWKNFQDLERKLTSKGYLMAGKFPPSWLVNGGENAQVQERAGDKKKNEAPVQIVVPDQVYNAYYYREVARQTRSDYIETSAEAMRGQSVKGLREDLSRLKYFIKETENQGSEK